MLHPRQNTSITYMAVMAIPMNYCLEYFRFLSFSNADCHHNILASTTTHISFWQIFPLIAWIILRHIFLAPPNNCHRLGLACSWRVVTVWSICVNRILKNRTVREKILSTKKFTRSITTPWNFCPFCFMLKWPKANTTICTQIHAAH